MQSETSNRLRGVWCNRPGNLFVVGDNRTLRRFDGSSWTAMTWTNPVIPKLDSVPLAVYSVWGTGNNDNEVFAGEDLLVRFDGNFWSLPKVPSAFTTGDSPFYGIWGSSATSVYMVAPRYVFHFDGYDITEVDWGASQPKLTLRSIWGIDETEIVVVTDTGSCLYYNPYFCDDSPALILRHSGGMWTTAKSPTMQSLLGVWGAVGQYLAVGNKGTMIRFDGKNWALTSTGSFFQLQDIAATGDTWVVVGSGGTLLRQQGDKWDLVQMQEDRQINAVWVVDATHVFLVGIRGGIYRYDGVKISTMQSETKADLFDIWGDTNGHLTAVGARGTILRYDGKQWTGAKSPVERNLYAVAGRGPNDIYAVGARSTVLHFDGKDWKTLVTGGALTYRAVVPSRARDAYVAGLRSIQRFDGTEWKTMLHGFRCDIEHLEVMNHDIVLATTACGDLLYFDGTRWIAAHSPTGKALRSSWAGANGFRVVGEDGTLLRGEVQ
jgi:hypothetical protein